MTYEADSRNIHQDQQVAAPGSGFGRVLDGGLERRVWVTRPTWLVVSRGEAAWFAPRVGLFGETSLPSGCFLV